MADAEMGSQQPQCCIDIVPHSSQGRVESVLLTHGILNTELASTEPFDTRLGSCAPLLTFSSSSQYLALSYCVLLKTVTYYILLIH